MSVARPGEVHVLAGVIFDSDNRVLLAQRPRNKDLAGYWEFPGGKIEPGETRYEALARELREELGIQIGPARPLTRVRHAYPHKTVLLDFWIVRQFAGEVQGLDGQSLQWCSPESLAGVPLLPADQPMLKLICLPEKITSRSLPGLEVVTSMDRRRPDRLAGVSCATVSDAERAAAQGADFVVLEERLEDATLSRLCDSLSLPVFAAGVTLSHAWNLGASGTTTLAESEPHFGVVNCSM